MKKIFLPLAMILLLALAACGGDAPDIDEVVDIAQEGLETAQEAVEDVVEEVMEDEDTAAATSNLLMIDDVIGTYTFHTPSSDWHYAEIVSDGEILRWINRAGVEWILTPDFENNRLLTDDSFPYQDEFQNFDLVVEDGEYKGFVSNDDFWAHNGSDTPSVSTDLWSGSVVTNGGNDTAGVTISINGAETQSDGDGNFDLSVPHADNGRYVINAAQDGHLSISQIHIGAALEELTLEFQPVETFTVDPTQPIDVEDSSGTQIAIDANELVDENGNPATEDLTLSMYTYDLTNEEMVGDMSGTNTDGEMVSMESAGAFYASFEDDAGDEYNLAEGAEAEISIPADEPNTEEVLTVWSYNEETGLWEEEGDAVYENGQYVAKVSHFSYWNFDYEKRTPACIKLDIEQSYLMENTPVQVKAILQTNPVRVRDLSISQETTVLINLPTNTDVQFFLLPNASTPFATINSGAPWGGIGVPASPYDICNGVADIAPAPEPTTGTLQGQVTNAVSGDPIADAQVCIQGTTQCVDTDANGNYTISDVAPGEQVLNVREDGYIPVNDQQVTVTAGETASRPIPMSPELAEGELRIVLTWGANPSDLDSHLFLPDNTDIDYNKKGQIINGVQLDLDETNGEGPETITILEQQDGSYAYGVYLYAGNGTIPTSNAVVRVYRGDQEIATYMADSLTGDGKWWYVFDLNGATGNITEVNTLSGNSPR